MHRCLQVADIQVLICTKLRLDLPLSSARPALASLAATCKDLSGPAIVALWWDLDALLPLFRLLPLDLFRFKNRHLQASDWGRWDVYAQHVRTLRLDRPAKMVTKLFAFGPFAPNIAVFAHAFSERAKITGLLPRLTSVTFDFEGRLGSDVGCFLNGVEHILSSLIGPRLQELKSAFKDKESATFIASVHQRSPNITFLSLRSIIYLYFTGGHNERPMLDLCAKCISNLSKTSHLKLPFLPKFSKPISSLSKLTHLTLDHNDEPLHVRVSDNTQARRRLQLLESSTLRHLHLRTTLSHITKFLPFIGHLPRLATLRIEDAIYPKDTHYSNSLEMFAHSIPKFLDVSRIKTLRTLSLSFQLPLAYLVSRLGPSADEQEIKIMQSFVQMSNLTELELLCDRPFPTHSLVGEHLPRIIPGNAWSSIQSLAFHCRPRKLVWENREYLMDLGDLRQFVISCPNLRRLQVDLNATEIPDDNSMTEGGVSLNSEHRTITLVVHADSPIEDGAAVAAFLRRDVSLRVVVECLSTDLGFLEPPPSDVKEWEVQKGEQELLVAVWAERWREVSRALGMASSAKR